MVTGSILITGGSGQVGGAVARLATSLGYDVSCPARDVLDLADERSITEFFRATTWSHVVNCAAYTAVDQAENDPELAFRINAAAPAVLSRVTNEKGVPVIHVSTDYVFDGTKFGPYDEIDPIAPLGVYGSSKAAGEDAIRNGNPQHAILRTAWILSAQGKNFLTTMLRIGVGKQEISVVDDQIGSPTGADDLAKAILSVITMSAATGKTWHVVNSGSASWHGLANHIFASAAKAGMIVPDVRPIPTSQYPTPAKRPANSVLSTRQIEADLGLTFRPWQTVVDDIVNERMTKGSM